MKKKVIFYFIMLLIFLILLFSVISYYSNLTGKIVEDINSYSYTKAVCNNSNYCEDYEIVCDGKEVISMTFTGFSIQNPSDWVDPRSKEIVENTC